jgi:hypothetical protein
LTVVIAGVATTGCAVSISDVFGRASTCAYTDMIVLKSNEAILRHDRSVRAHSGIRRRPTQLTPSRHGIFA